MKRRSLSRKEILRRAEQHAARSARQARQGPLADVQPLIAASRTMRDRPAVWNIPGVPWDMPVRSTPLADIRAARGVLLGISPLRPAYRIWRLYKASLELL